MVSASTDYKLIQDYDYTYESGEIKIPEDIPAALSEIDRNPLLKKIAAVFELEEGRVCLEDIRNSKNYGPPGAKWNQYISCAIDSFAVSFDRNGKVEKELLISEKYTVQTKAIQQIMVKMMERLASELSWTNTTRRLGCFAVDFKSDKSSSDEPLRWHSAGYEAIAKHSFHVLLSNPNDESTGGTGGDLLYTFGRRFARSDDWNERRKIYSLNEKTQGEFLNEPNTTVWQMSYSQNDGILIGNEGMRHKITTLHPTNAICTRLMLIILDYGVETEFELSKRKFMQIIA